MLSRLASLAIRRPLVVAGVWWTMVGVLTVIGLGVGDRLHRTSLVMSGTGAARAAAVQDREFGERNPVTIMLRGPGAAVDAQGPAVTRALARVPQVTVFGPWSGAAVPSMRPRPDRALIIAVVHRAFEPASRYSAPQLRRVLKQVVRPPVRSYMTGFIDAAAALHDSAVSGIERAELIAAPILMVVLLIVLGSPIAASIPLVIGGSVVASCTGALDLINRVIVLDSLSLNLASMMGLALGVDYTLLTLARFRREQANGASVQEAATVALATAGRTVRFAGLVLALAMLTGLLVAPGGILLSSGIGVIVAVLLSLLASYTVLPAAVVFWAPYLDKWRLFEGAASSTRWGQRAFKLIRRPGLAAAAVAAFLLLLASPALGLSAGPPDARELPGSAPARTDFAAIQRTFGGGWGAPFEITVVSPRGPITSSAGLKTLAAFERRLRSRPRVLAEFGAGAIESRTSALRSVPARLTSASRQFKRGTRGIGSLENGLAQAGSGADQLAQGLGAASLAASQIATGGTSATDGVRALNSGIDRAMGGAQALSDGLVQAANGTRAADAGARQAADGSAALSAGLDQAASGVRDGAPQLMTLANQLEVGADGLGRLRVPVEVAQGQLQQTLSALDSMSPVAKQDPSYRRAYQAAANAYGAITGHNPQTGGAVAPGYDGLDAALAQASSQARAGAAGVRTVESRMQVLIGGLERLSGGATRLERGLESLQSGLAQLTRGGDRLRAGARALVAGIAKLQNGGGALADGLWSLAGGGSQLSSGLDSAHANGATLATGVAQLESGTQLFARQTRGLGGQFNQLNQLGPLFGSGYSVLAALDTATPAQRNAASFAVNLDRGGDAADVVVVKNGAPTRANDKLRAQLERDATAFNRQTGAQVAVGGPAVTLEDFDLTVKNAYIPYILALSIVSYLVLIPILRSIVLPAIAVGLNLLTVAAAYGVLAATFQGRAPLGGPGFIDDLMVAAIFNVVFALSIDYEVFLLARVREGYDRLGDTNAAIRYALEHTAGVITGAAAIMTAVFFAFSLSSVINMRELGLGLTVAVVLDATVVRLVLLPACLKIAGRWNWWLPQPLARIIPDIDWEGERHGRHQLRQVTPLTGEAGS